MVWSGALVGLTALHFRQRAAAAEERHGRQLAELRAQLDAQASSMEALSTTDPQTGLANRRVFDDVLQQRWRWLGREQDPLALLICDVDQLPPGPRGLESVAHALKSAVLRPLDLVARIGDDRFAVVLCEADVLGATAVARRIRRTLRETDARSSDGARLTLSIGVAATVPTSSRDPQELVGQAESALAEAKEKGRDRVVGGRADASHSGGA